MTIDRGLLAGALLLLVVAVWIEPSGSWLGEPDEARYAEIPREMLAARDLVTPRLNGVPYFEKPPLLYWSNAGAFALFGQTPWAARLPTRLAGVGTVALTIWCVASSWGIELGLSAGIFLLASPLGFALSRVNITDGMLTFFFTATLLAARETLLRRQQRRPWAIWSCLAGLAAAGALLTKGLVGVVLPGGILLVWCLACGKMRHLRALLFAPAPFIFLTAAAPWFVVAAFRHPGFLEFFFVHEHFRRFATSEAHREGPIFYFVAVFLAGFLPGLPFFVAALRDGVIARWRREQPEALFFLIWFLGVFLFFSFSSSKLPSYLLPAFPAAAALAARGFGAMGSRPGPWRAAIALAALLPLGVVAHPATRRALSDHGLLTIALAGFALLLAGVGAAPGLARRSRAAALASLAAGWFGFCAAAALAWPRIPPATELHHLEVVACEEASRAGAQVVGYQAYIQGLPWELKHPIPVADYVGELEPQFERDLRLRDGLFWSRERFWREWNAGQKILAVVRARDLGEFGTARIVLTSRKHVLVANF